MTRSSTGSARFAFPPDLARHGVAIGRHGPVAAPSCASASAIRAGSAPIRKVAANGRPLRLQPGGGSGGGRGFFAWIDAAPLTGAADGRRVTTIDFAAIGSLTLAPQAGDTRWTVRLGLAASVASAATSCRQQRQVDDEGLHRRLPHRQSGARPLAGLDRRRRAAAIVDARSARPSRTTARRRPRDAARRRPRRSA